MKIVFAECTNNGIIQEDSNELFLSVYPSGTTAQWIIDYKLRYRPFWMLWDFFYDDWKKYSFAQNRNNSQW